VTIEEAAKIANLLGGASFATLLVIVLVGNKLRIWRWGEDVRELEARHTAEKGELEERYEAEKAMVVEQLNFWRDIALRNTGLLETQADRLLQVATQVGAVNRHLLGGGAGSSEKK
jgi:hypothetical protein